MNRRSRRRVAAGMAGVAACTVVLAGCSAATSSSGSGSSGSSSTSSSSSTASGPSKDVVIGYNAIDNLDTIEFRTSSDYMITNNIYGTLVQENYRKQNGILVGSNTYSTELANSLTWNAAGTLLTIKLKPGLKFQNGAALTSADVVYSLQRALSSASYASAFMQYMGIANPATDIKAVDPTTLTVTTRFKAPLMEKFLSFPVFGVLDKAAGDAHKTSADPWAKAYFAKNVISSGPYEVQSWPSQDSMVLTKNPDFTVENLADSPPTVTVQNITDPNQEYLALQQGQIDIALGLLPKLAKQAQTASNVTVATSPASDLVYLGYNNTDPELKNAKVRQALSYLIPYNSLRSDVYAGFANSAYGPAPYPMQSALDSTGTKDAYPTNVAKAKQLLSEAGVKKLTISLAVDIGDPTAIQAATFIQSAFAQAGVTVKVNQLQSAQYDSELGAHQFQTFLGEWYSWGQDPIYQMFFLLDSISPVDYTGYSNPDFNSLVAKAITESSVATRDQLSRQAQQIAINDAPMSYLYTRNYIVVSNSNVSGVTQPDDEFPYFQYLRVK
jgi:peptide/nickel transport system substrate-binding protein